jgi:GR25 family glycosyltransferase involved in LPS biosynthesis
MDTRLPDIGIFIIGVPENLRNPALTGTCKAAVFVSPVFIDDQKSTSFRQALIEFILNGRKLSAAERGCTLAHINVRKRILASGHDWVLVLEDDVGLPADWEAILNEHVDLRAHKPAVLILNTDEHFNLGVGLIEMKLKPSSANAFLIHRKVLEARPFFTLEMFEIADWPISFSETSFYSLSKLAFDTKGPSLIGLRPRGRIAFLTSILVRLLFLPLNSMVTAVPIPVLARWTLTMPLQRDLALRARYIQKALLSASGSFRTYNTNRERHKK